MSASKNLSFVILDRDGVINEDSDAYIKSADEWFPIPGSLEAIAQLTRAGVDVYIATNQAGIARGKLSLTDLEGIHHKMLREVERAGGVICDIQYCPHHPSDQCHCRKPQPGMLLNLASKYSLTLSEGYFVGDSQKDLIAADKAGCTGVLVLTGKGQETLKAVPNHSPVFENLLRFTESIL